MEALLSWPRRFKQCRLHTLPPSLPRCREARYICTKYSIIKLRIAGMLIDILIHICNIKLRKDNVIIWCSIIVIKAYKHEYWWQWTIDEKSYKAINKGGLHMPIHTTGWSHCPPTSNRAWLRSCNGRKTRPINSSGYTRNNSSVGQSETIHQVITWENQYIRWPPKLYRFIRSEVA